MAISGIVTFAFIETIPLEFFYFESVYAFFGGLPVYYLGVYNYGAMVSKPEDRAHRIAILDGVETLATLIGTLLSPGMAHQLNLTNLKCNKQILTRGKSYPSFKVKNTETELLISSTLNINTMKPHYLGRVIKKLIF